MCSELWHFRGILANSKNNMDLDMKICLDGSNPVTWFLMSRGALTSWSEGKIWRCKWRKENVVLLISRWKEGVMSSAMHRASKTNKASEEIFFPSPTHILSLNSGDLHKTCNLHKSKTIHWWCLVFGQIGNVFQQQQKFNEKLYFNCHLSAITVSLDSLSYS